MTISTEYPPNYEAIKTAFPAVEGGTSLFAYGSTIYNPFNLNVPQHLIVHEEVHEKQQGANPESWWNQYISDPSFRLTEEIEAYGTQFQFIKKHLGKSKYTTMALNDLATHLSSDIYGDMISLAKAKKLIKNYGNTAI